MLNQDTFHLVKGNSCDKSGPIHMLWGSILLLVSVSVASSSHSISPSLDENTVGGGNLESRDGFKLATM